MLVYGTGGHALELLDELRKLNISNICFFNNIDSEITNFYNFDVLKSMDEINNRFGKTFQFIVGIGNPMLRFQKQQELINQGGQPTTIISKNALIGSYDVTLGKGLNIMSGVHISSRVYIGNGCLINRNSNIHHDVKIGEFCEIAPNTSLLGNVEIANRTFIGAGAIVLPGVKIGQNCVIGAGALVTRDVPDFLTVKGNPAK